MSEDLHMTEVPWHDCCNGCGMMHAASHMAGLFLTRLCRYCYPPPQAAFSAQAIFAQAWGRHHTPLGCPKHSRPRQGLPRDAILRSAGLLTIIMVCTCFHSCVSMPSTTPALLQGQHLQHFSKDNKGVQFHRCYDLVQPPKAKKHD